MASFRLIILPIHQTFKSKGYINSSPSGEDKDIVAPFLTFMINATTKKEAAESVCPTVYLYLPDFKMNNRSTMEIHVLYELSK